MIESNIKSGVSIFGVSGNMVSWDRPNTFTFWENLDSYTSTSSSYFFDVKFYPSMDDAINKTNLSSISTSGLENSWGNIRVNLNMNSYDIVWELFFLGIEYYSSRKIKGYKNETGYVYISHRVSGSTYYDWFSPFGVGNGSIGDLNENYVTCSIKKTAIDSYGSPSSVTKTSFPMRRNTIHY